MSSRHHLVICVSRFGHVFMAETGTSVGEISGQSKSINSCDFRPARPFRIVTGCEDNTIGVFEGPPFKFKMTKQVIFFPPVILKIISVCICVSLLYQFSKLFWYSIEVSWYTSFLKAFVLCKKLFIGRIYFVVFLNSKIWCFFLISFYECILKFFST